MKKSTPLALKSTVLEFIEMNLAFIDSEVTLQYDDNIFALGYVDSLFALQLVTYLEEAFDIEITDQDLDISNFNSVKAIVEFVNRKRG
jgi:acyl carrier protein